MHNSVRTLAGVQSCVFMAALLGYVAASFEVQGGGLPVFLCFGGVALAMWAVNDLLNH